MHMAVCALRRVFGSDLDSASFRHSTILHLQGVLRLGSSPSVAMMQRPNAGVGTTRRGQVGLQMSQQLLHGFPSRWALIHKGVSRTRKQKNLIMVGLTDHSASRGDREHLQGFHERPWA